jgi:hypothetical protein
MAAFRNSSGSCCTPTLNVLLSFLSPAFGMGMAVLLISVVWPVLLISVVCPCK